MDFFSGESNFLIVDYSSYFWETDKLLATAVAKVIEINYSSRLDILHCIISDGGS